MYESRMPEHLTRSGSGVITGSANLNRRKVRVVVGEIEVRTRSSTHTYSQGTGPYSSPLWGVMTGLNTVRASSLAISLEAA